jgi:hypothetical protein
MLRIAMLLAPLSIYIASNKSLDQSNGSVFRIKRGAAKVE